jgi:hypothetical protein
MPTDVLTIALTLVGFVVGLVIALLYAGTRSRSMREAYTARINGLAAELGGRAAEVDELRTALADRTADADAATSELRALQSELGIQKAQFEETQAEMGAIEDRLNAAEARVLSADAELADRSRQVDEWSRAYALLRATNDNIQVEHGEAEERRRRLEDDLQVQRLELAELTAKLEAMQAAASLQSDSESDEPTTLQQRVAAISLLKATAESGLRRREMELAEVRNQLSALRFSINVITSSAAELAAIAGAPLFGIEPPAGSDPLDRPAHRPTVPLREPGDRAQQAEEFAGLEGMIADWFAEIRSQLPYPPGLLRTLAGVPVTSTSVALKTAAALASDEPAAGSESADQPVDARTDALAPSQPVSPDLPPALMLAAIKAAATHSLERSVNRQYELAARLTESEAEYEELVTRIQAWRSMLHITLQSDGDLLRLLEKQDVAEGDAATLLSACATVALTAYQKQQDALRRVQRGIEGPRLGSGGEQGDDRLLPLIVPPPAPGSIPVPAGPFSADSRRFRRRRRF